MVDSQDSIYYSDFQSYAVAELEKIRFFVTSRIQKKADMFVAFSNK